MILSISEYLNENVIQMLTSDFENVVKDVGAGDFGYFDLPYIPLSETSIFIAYIHKGFSYGDQVRLRDTVKDLHERGVYVMLFNFSSFSVEDLYRNFTLYRISVTRTNGANVSSRGKIKEIVVTIY